MMTRFLVAGVLSDTASQLTNLTSTQMDPGYWRPDEPSHLATAKATKAEEMTATEAVRYVSSAVTAK